MAVARYNTDGRLDQSFNDSGKVTYKFEQGVSTAASVAIQNNGKIVVGGTTAGSFGIVRLLQNGTADSTFGIKGKQVTDVYEYD